jgi:hypothetical protein
MIPPAELLIDFREIIGQHSGENMAAVVWSTLETYDIHSKVRKIYINNILLIHRVVRSLL